MFYNWVPVSSKIMSFTLVSVIFEYIYRRCLSHPPTAPGVFVVKSNSIGIVTNNRRGPENYRLYTNIVSVIFNGLRIRHTHYFQRIPNIIPSNHQAKCYKLFKKLSQNKVDLLKTHNQEPNYIFCN